VAKTEGYLFCSSVMLLSLALYRWLAPSLQLANFTAPQPRNDPYLGKLWNSVRSLAYQCSIV